MKHCAYCGIPIEDEKPHYSYLDNYLQAKYFDSEENNIFCSEDCAGKALFLTEIEPEGSRKKSGKGKTFFSDAAGFRII